MPIAPQFEYFLSNAINPVDEHSRIWRSPLPMHRKASQKTAGTSVTYGEYFFAIRSFLAKDNFHTVASAISRRIKAPVKPEEIKKICVYLEKHGEFYHPARVETLVHGSGISFVLNVAISDAGKNCIKREYRSLERLNGEFPFSFIPEIYGKDEVHTKDNHKIIMFLGEWFEGFHEFHISSDPTNDPPPKNKTEQNQKIIVWDTVKGNFYLSKNQILELYKQAAMILTCYYNMETFEQIFPWHHAAGDFILKLQDDKIDLRLITVRQYAPVIENKEMDKQAGDIGSILEALLIFFLNLSIRMRIDRIDGVGEMVWAYDIAVEGTIDGFFKGLDQKPLPFSIPQPFSDFFRTYLLSFWTEADLYELSSAMVNACNPKAPDLPVIKRNLKKHIQTLYHAIN